MLHQHLSRIMDLPYPHCNKEASKKLSDTWCVVNGELVLVSDITDDSILIVKPPKMTTTFTLTDEDVKSFEVWLPQSGVYLVDNIPIFVMKKPFRQWRKSFSLSFYTVFDFYYTELNLKDVLPKLYNTKPCPLGFWKSKTNELFYFHTKIGDYIHGNYININNLFEQEVIDLTKKGLL